MAAFSSDKCIQDNVAVQLPLVILSASNFSGADSNIIVPEGIDVSSIRLPTKINSCDLRLDAAPLPLRRIAISHTRLASEAGDGISVQPCLDRSIRP